MAPGEIVVDEESRWAPALNPGVIEPSDGRERVGTAALQHDGEGRERFLKVTWPKQTLIPGKCGIEVVHKILREDVRVSSRERIERLRGDRVKHRINRIRPCGLEPRVCLKTKPCRIFLVDVIVGANGLHLFMVVAGMRDALPVGTSC